MKILTKLNCHKVKKLFLVLCFAGLNSTGFAQKLKIALVLDKGGKDDKSFNASAYSGAQKAEKDFGIELKLVEATDDNAFQPLLRAFAERKYDLIIGIGFSQKDAITKVASQYKDRKFLIVDGEVDAPNVRSIMFSEHEASYLIGAIAGYKTKTNKIGFAGGMDIPLIRRFQLGFEAGLKKANPKATVTSGYVGVTGDAWNNPPKAKELSLSQYKSGVDIIFAVAGASNQGIFDAAEEKKLFAIGVDSNQNWVKPGLILTSMLKRVDLGVYSTIEDLKNGRFTNGIKHLGLKEDGVGYAVDQYNEKLLPKDIIAKIEAIKKEIITGKINVPDYYKTSKK